MGAGAVNGHNKEFKQTAESQNQENQFVRGPTNVNHNTGGGDSQPAPPSSNGFNQSSPGLSTLAAPTARINSPMKMSCEMCSANFSFFKRKKCCQECQRFFCSSCLPKPRPSTAARQCSKCRMLVSGHFSRDDLKSWKINDMRCFLNVRNISTKDCREKHDLIDIVLSRFCTRPRQSIQQQAEHEDLVRQMADNMRNVSFVQESSHNSSTASSNKSSPSATRNEGTTNVRTPAAAAASTSTPSGNSAAESSTQATGTQSSTAGTGDANEQGGREDEGFMDTIRLGQLLQSIQDALEDHIYGEGLREEPPQQEQQQQEPTVTAPRRTQLEDIASVSAIDNLTNRQMKELLINNFVDYKGCIEKEDLIARTKMLWMDHQENKARAERIHRQEEADYYGESSHKSDPTSKQEEEEKTSTKDNAESAATSDSIPNVTEASTTTAATTTDVPPENATASASLTSAASSSNDKDKHVNDSLCSICMDSLVDCIMLECGHMVTCTQCGKRLASCPVCRQYVVRVVRVFRS